MDGFVLTLWLIRILFLVLLYGFLFAVVRVLLRDLRAASRGPTELGRLIVLASPHGEPPVGTSFPLDAVTTLGRDVNNAIVVDDPFASAEHTVLTFRGRAWYVEDLGEHQRDVRQRRARRARRAARVRRRAPGGRGPVPARPGPRVTAARAGARAAAGSASSRARAGPSSPARHRRRPRCSSAARRSAPASTPSVPLDAGRPRPSIDLMPPDLRGLVVYLVALFVVHLAFVLAGRRTDQVLLPATAMLGGIGLLLMQRLPQDLVVQQFGDAELGLGQLQLGWLLLALGGDRGARARRPLRRLAAHLQVHVGRRRHRAARADVRARQRRQRRAPHALDRARCPASRRSS